MTAGGPTGREFWFGRTDPRPLAALRIGFGAALLFELADLARHTDALFTRDSFFPSRSLHDPNGFGLFLLVDGKAGAALLLVAYAAALAAFTVGFRTRWASVAAWALCVSVHYRNPVYMSGGNWMAQLMLFWSIFADVGEVWSVDARKHRRAPRMVFAAPLRAMQLHLSLMYFVTGRLKFRGTWRSGWGVFLSLQLAYFNRPPGTWMLEHPGFTRFTTYSVLALELAFIFLVFSPVANRFGQLAAALVNIGIQIGVLLSMKVGIFTALMLIATVIFIPPFVWERVFGALPASTEAAPPLSPSRSEWAGVIVQGIAIVMISWGAFVGGRIHMPQALNDVAVAFGIDQPYALFDRFYPRPMWEVTGTRADGALVDLIPVVTPGLRPNHEWLADPWVKGAFNLHQAEPRDLARFFCVGYRRESGERLASVKVVWSSQMQSLPGTPENPTVVRVLHDGACPD